MPIDMRRVIQTAADVALKQSQPTQQPAPKKPRLSAGKAMLIGAGVGTAGRLLAGPTLRATLESLQQQIADSDLVRNLSPDNEEPEAEDEEGFDEEQDEEEPEAEDEEDFDEEDEPEADVDEDEYQDESDEEEFEDEEDAAPPRRRRSRVRSRA